MPLSDQTLIQLHKLVTENADLVTQLQTASDANQAAALITRAADMKGIVVSEVELAEHLGKASRNAASQALNDNQLEAVAGGLSDDGRMALISVFTFGIGCAVVSISQAIDDALTPNQNGKKFC